MKCKKKKKKKRKTPLAAKSSFANLVAVNRCGGLETFLSVAPLGSDQTTGETVSQAAEEQKQQQQKKHPDIPAL